MEHTGNVVQDYRDAQGAQDLDEKDSIAAVQLIARQQGEVDDPSEEGMHRADVVQHILIIHCDAHEKNDCNQEA